MRLRQGAAVRQRRPLRPTVGRGDRSSDPAEATSALAGMVRGRLDKLIVFMHPCEPARRRRGGFKCSPSSKVAAPATCRRCRSVLSGSRCRCRCDSGSESPPKGLSGTTPERPPPSLFPVSIIEVDVGWRLRKLRVSCTGEADGDGASAVKHDDILPWEERRITGIYADHRSASSGDSRIQARGLETINING